MDTLIGKTFGSYQILAEIGRGGMATVYKAYQPSLNCFVAIKVLPPAFAHDDDFVRRFKLEAQNAVRLKHPNIVIIHDIGEADSYHYIVMEYLEGSTLRALIEQNGALPESRAIRILAQIANALDYAHRRGFVHRDVKPSNIIVAENDFATLTDFGIAKAVDGTKLTRTGAMVGTPEYMSPEQARGETVDHRTDIYSLGVVAYEMLCGRVPFCATTPHAVLHKIIYEPPPRLRAINPQVSPRSEQAVMGALAKNVTERYRDAAEFARRAAPPSNQSTTAPAVNVLAQATLRPRTAQRARITTLLIVLGIGLALLGIGLAIAILADPPVPYKAVTLVNAIPYTVSRLQPITSERAIVIRLYAEGTAQVLDLFLELANENSSEVTIFVAPFCDKPYFIGLARLDSNRSPRPVWIKATENVIVRGEFCVYLQATAGSNTSIALNPNSQYLIRVAVTDD